MALEEILLVLHSLECELHRPKTRHDTERLAQLLHPEFHEFGRSGRTYTRTEILAQLQAEIKPMNIHAQNFRVVMLADSVYLLTYRSAHVASTGLLKSHTNRSSVWRLESGGWQMLFHQGTPTDAFVQDTFKPTA